MIDKQSGISDEGRGTTTQVRKSTYFNTIFSFYTIGRAIYGVIFIYIVRQCQISIKLKYVYFMKEASTDRTQLQAYNIPQS